MDLDDLLGRIFAESVLGGLGRSRRVQLLLRMFFGLLGAGLCLAGALHFLVNPPSAGSPALHASMVGLFVSVASFFGFNVMLARPWTRPIIAIVASVVAMFAVRLLIGA
jgi:hypothetical protein